MQWRRDDILRLMWLTPTPLSVLGSRYAVALGIGLVQAVLFTGVAMLPLSWACVRRLAAGPAAAAAGVTAFLVLGLIVGSFANTPEAVAAIANCLMVPMAFLSGAFYPLT